MRRSALLFIILAMAVGALAWMLRSQKSETTLSTAENIANTGRVVRVAMEGSYAPFNFTNAEGKLSGFDYDIAVAVCAAAQLTCEFITQAWDGLIPGLLTSRYDIIASSLSITEARKQAVAFSNRYYRTPIRFLVPSDAGFIVSDEGLKNKRIGAQRATTSATYLEERYRGIVDVKLYDTHENGLSDLAAGRLDAYIADALMTWQWLQSPEGQKFGFRGETVFVDQGIGMALRKDDTELLATINTALEKIRADGTYQSINDKYFPFSIY
ncbi:MAG: transporter substrate-binding domain-containing protein [Holosporales bacterium]